MLGIGWFDLFFFTAVVLCEIHWYRKSKQDDKAFSAFQSEIREQLLEVSQRLEIAIEKEDKPTTSSAVRHVQAAQEPKS